MFAALKLGSICGHRLLKFAPIDSCIAALSIGHEHRCEDT